MLIANGVRAGGGPMRYHGGVGPLAVDRPRFAQFALAVGFNLSEATVVAGASISDSFGIPAGVRHPQSWVMPIKGGGIKSFRRAVARVDASADGELGLARAAASTITITAQAAGGLIASLTGTATITVNGQAAIVATLSSAGLATITINAAVALAAEASMVASALLTVEGSSASMGLGFFTATTVDSGVLTPAGIAAAVWQALAAEFNVPGSMGAKLNTASSGGVDYAALAAAVIAAAQLDPIHANVVQVNSLDVDGTGTEGDPWGPV